MLSPSRTDRVLLWSLRGLGLAAGSVLLLVATYVVAEAWPALSSVATRRFLTDPTWHPAAGPEAGTFGLAPMLAGTLAASMGALLLAGPAGVLVAIHARFLAPRPVGTAILRMVAVLAGIPSVVFGFWGLTTLAPIILRWRPPGQSLLAGILVLALMILPTVALLADSAFRQIPRADLQAAAALGLSRRATLLGVVLPRARGGLVAAHILALARALGETMAVLMVMGNAPRLPRSLFDSARALTAHIALELGYAMDIHRSALFAGGLLLLALTFGLHAAALRLDGRVHRD